MDEGFLVINKSLGITSFGVIARLRRITGIKRIGHCGTLDPLATGVLICAIGRGATRRIGELIKSDKKYLAKIELGKTSDTYDAESVIKNFKYTREPTLADVNWVLKEFAGVIDQVPPIYSAKKVKGTPAHRLVRRGKEVVMKPQKITISEIKVVAYEFPVLELEISCGSGTYIRSLANDIGKKLKTGGYLAALVRTKVGEYEIARSVELDKIDVLNWKKHIF